MSGSNPVRFQLAKKLDTDFIDSILTRPGNKIGLVAYGTKALGTGTAYTYGLSTNAAALKSQINGYTANNGALGGSTCICCAIRRARMLIESGSAPSRNKFIILMTDGVANKKCYSDQTNTNGWGYTMCCPSSRGVADVHPSCLAQYGSSVKYALIYDFAASSSQCQTASFTGWYKAACMGTRDSVGISQGISDACAAHNALGVKIYSIGMFNQQFASGCAEGVSLLSSIASCADGQSFVGTSPAELEGIYQKF